MQDHEKLGYLMALGALIGPRTITALQLFLNALSNKGDVELWNH